MSLDAPYHFLVFGIRILRSERHIPGGERMSFIEEHDVAIEILLAKIVGPSIVWGLRIISFPVSFPIMAYRRIWYYLRWGWRYRWLVNNCRKCKHMTGRCAEKAVFEFDIDGPWGWGEVNSAWDMCTFYRPKDSETQPET